MSDIHFNSSNYNRSLKYGPCKTRYSMGYSRGNNIHLASFNKKGWPATISGEESPEQLPAVILYFVAAGSRAPLSGHDFNVEVIEAKVGYHQVSPELVCVRYGVNSAVYVVLDRSVNWSPSDPLRLRIRVSGEEYITSYEQIVSYNKTQMTHLVFMTNVLVPPKGAAGIVKKIYLGSGGVTNDINLSFPTTAEKPETVMINVPAGTKIYDENGKEMRGELTIKGVHFSSMVEQSSESLPGGFLLTDYTYEDGTRNEVDDNRFFNSAGFFSLEVSDNNGNKASKLSTPMNVTMELNPSQPFNVFSEEERLVEDGDSVPLWSISEDGKWHLEGDLPISGGSVSFSTDHLSTYNLDWHENPCNGGNPVCVGLSQNSNVIKEYFKVHGSNAPLTVVVTSPQQGFFTREFAAQGLYDSEGKLLDTLCFRNVPPAGLIIEILAGVAANSYWFNPDTCKWEAYESSTNRGVLLRYTVSCFSSSESYSIPLDDIPDLEVPADYDPPPAIDTTLGCCTVLDGSGNVITSVNNITEQWCQQQKCNNVAAGAVSYSFEPGVICPGSGCCKVTYSVREFCPNGEVSAEFDFDVYTVSTPSECEQLGIDGSSVSEFLGEGVECPEPTPYPSIDPCDEVTPSPSPSPSPSPEPSPSPSGSPEPSPS